MSVGVSFAASADILPAGTRLRLLRDRILLRPLDWVPSSLIQVVRHGRPLRGVVEAVGPGRLYRRYKQHTYDRNKRTYVETGHFIPTQVKPGDVVELGGLNAYDGQGYNFPQVTIGTETFIIIQEQDICFVCDRDRVCICCAGDHRDVHEIVPTSECSLCCVGAKDCTSSEAA